VPARDYRLLADLVVAAADEAGTPVRDTLERAAREVGRSLADAMLKESPRRADALEELLRRQGYEPYDAEPDLLRLRNCPFDAVASRHPRLVCALNLALIESMLERLGRDAGDAALAPQRGCCCVAIRTPA
jgi:predicted ArsR family transcriptional regulator